MFSAKFAKFLRAAFFYRTPPVTASRYSQILDWWWNTDNNISFHFSLFSEKINDKIFQKIQKKTYVAILGTFCPNLGKIEFSCKKRLCQFLNITIIYHRAKNQKKLISHSCEKCLTDSGTDRQTDGQMYRRRWFYRTSVEWGCRNCIIVVLPLLLL